jgi:hypothetical protein
MSITVKEFVEKFNNDKVTNSKINPNAISDYIKKELEVKDYLPFADKRELCARVLNTCNSIDENGLVKVDSVSRYITFTISILSKYTNLEFSSGGDEELDSLDEYDMLCQNGLLNPILDVIGGEYATCNNILNMMMEDIISNNNTIENVLGTASDRLLDSVDRIVDALADKIDELELDLSQIDIEKLTWVKDLLLKK